MKMSKVGNQTNSQDPQAVNSRVFVGNLNTYQCSKTDVERMFQRYGRLAGISMHKGYAFVQFTNPFDARGACLGEDGRTVLGQTLDVNMVAEPKPHQTGRKRQNVAKTGNDWDYYYDSYYASGAAFTGAQRLVPSLKRPRMLIGSVSSGANGAGGGGSGGGGGITCGGGGGGGGGCSRPKQMKTSAALSPPPQVKVYSNPDVLICGNCREMFSELHELLEHKKEFCKLRFTCKCSSLNGNFRDIEESVSLTCVQCKERFTSAWDLMVHVQAAHMLNIYELATKTAACGSPRPIDASNTNDEDRSLHMNNNGQAKIYDNCCKDDGSMVDEHLPETREEVCGTGTLSIEANVSRTDALTPSPPPPPLLPTSSDVCHDHPHMNGSSATITASE